MNGWTDDLEKALDERERTWLEHIRAPDDRGHADGSERRV